MPNETYTLNYTAEQINHRLDLIEPNKNLLPYKYAIETLQAGLADVGDGSFLTTGIATMAETIFLNDVILPAGNDRASHTTYVYSLEITDMLDPLVTVTNPGFELCVIGANNEEKANPFTLHEEETVTVSLQVPPGYSTKNLLIKPMIREANKDDDWVPYMKTIGSYVDERFNSTNTKLKDVLAFMKLVEIIDDEE